MMMVGHTIVQRRTAEYLFQCCKTACLVLSHSQPDQLFFFKQAIVLARLIDKKDSSWSNLKQNSETSRHVFHHRLKCKEELWLKIQNKIIKHNKENLLMWKCQKDSDNDNEKCDESPEDEPPAQVYSLAPEDDVILMSWPWCHDHVD